MFCFGIWVEKINFVSVIFVGWFGVFEVFGEMIEVLSVVDICLLGLFVMYKEVSGINYCSFFFLVNCLYRR